MNRQIKVQVEKFPIAGKFVIARGSRTEAVVVTVLIQEGTAIGRGECVPYGRYGETADSVIAAIEKMRAALDQGMTRAELQDQMKPGAARNAIDSALWDLEAKQSGVRAYVRAGVQMLSPVTTAYTISLDSPQGMAAMSNKASHRPILKIKLGAPEGDLERIHAVREAAPNAILIADANEGWTKENLNEHINACAKANFALIEQPLPSSSDEPLRSVERKVPICADESFHDRTSLDRLVGLYDMVNIKLDKTGGLTEALLLADAAQNKGFELMIGCMVGTSLAMAPALTLASRARFVDLDGPLLLARDRDHGLVYQDSEVHPPSVALWG